MADSLESSTKAKSEGNEIQGSLSEHRALINETISHEDEHCLNAIPVTTVLGLVAVSFVASSRYSFFPWRSMYP